MFSSVYKLPRAQTAVPIKPLQIVIVGLAFLALSSCGLFPMPHHCQSVDSPDTQLSKIKPGITSRDEVHSLLGNPVIVNSEWKLELYQQSVTVTEGDCIVGLVPPMYWMTSEEEIYQETYFAVIIYDDQDLVRTADLQTIIAKNCADGL